MWSWAKDMRASVNDRVNDWPNMPAPETHNSHIFSQSIHYKIYSKCVE